jgi:hypothetical protein
MPLLFNSAGKRMLRNGKLLYGAAGDPCCCVGPCPTDNITLTVAGVNTAPQCVSGATPSICYLFGCLVAATLAVDGVFVLPRVGYTNLYSAVLASTNTIAAYNETAGFCDPSRPVNVTRYEATYTVALDCETGNVLSVVIQGNFGLFAVPYIAHFDGTPDPLPKGVEHAFPTCAYWGAACTPLTGGGSWRVDA